MFCDVCATQAPFGGRLFREYDKRVRRHASDAVITSDYICIKRYFGTDGNDGLYDQSG